MIDVEKLLGGLLGGSGGLGKLGGVSKGFLPNKAAIGVGLLGVAMAAFEHFAEQKTAGSSSAGTSVPPPSPGSASAPPPPPGSSSVPPPVPGVVSPAMPTGAFASTGSPLDKTVAVAEQADPMLLIRAMIASANADGVLDETERMRILGQLEGVGLTEEEKDFLCAEFDVPWSLQAIAAATTSPTIAAQIFTVSLLAVDIDTQEESNYLEGLRLALGLESIQAQSIARRLGKQI